MSRPSSRHRKTMGFSGGYRAYALDAARAAELWRKSEDLVGERY
ncbi:hypothetical protein [Variovorax beijingensis]|nr:hypothetical protein [Variovorax beijingensis]